FLLCLPAHRRSTLFPYTTLFRSADRQGTGGERRLAGGAERRGAEDDGALSEGNDPGRPGAGYGAGDHSSERHWLTCGDGSGAARDRKSTRLNSSHVSISYAVFCL